MVHNKNRRQIIVYIPWEMDLKCHILIIKNRERKMNKIFSDVLRKERDITKLALRWCMNEKQDGPKTWQKAVEEEIHQKQLLC